MVENRTGYAETTVRQLGNEAGLTGNSQDWKSAKILKIILSVILE